ncbi:hypothetical protein J5X84_42195 [Streptosporangiaceae bacterium NEAU-GS5]|nr:hypothetical protein [Streptosporangiaceae bacterium NEAU-GS5]
MIPTQDAARAAGELTRLGEQIGELYEATRIAESTWATQIEHVDPGNRASARNLVHYWRIRQGDLRDLQRRLAERGRSPC